MAMDGFHQQIVNRRSFFGTLAWGVSMTLIMLIIGGASIILYGMNIADRKSDSLFTFANQAVNNLPAMLRSMPPLISDMLQDERRPDYVGQIQVVARVSEQPLNTHHGECYGRPIVLEVHNSGKDVVSLLSLHVSAVNSKNEPMTEGTVWVATPIACDEDWSGPLMPGSTRRITARDLRFFVNANESKDITRIDTEISDVRVWKPQSQSSRVETAYKVEATKPAS